MIAYKGREVKRGRKSQMARNLERLYKESQCRDCSVIVTRMDFAKILGKFTKVKIQYENVSSPKSKKVAPVESPKDMSRLKNNENGLVLIRRNAYNKHPINNSQLNRKKSKSLFATETSPRHTSNVLKENNGLKKYPTPILKDKNSNYNTKNNLPKQYTIIFVDPKSNNNKDCSKKSSLADIVPKINKEILPSEEWCIEYLPKIEQTRNDKVYDRIEAELEGLMYSEKSEGKSLKLRPDENKVDDFPSIMDILNDNYTATEPKQNDQNVIIDFKNNLESSDVEAMLLGKSSNIKISESTPMEVDSSVMSKLIEDVENISAVASVEKSDDKSEQIVELSIKENPQSPSILDETLQKGAEEHIPAIPLQSDTLTTASNTTIHAEDDKTCGPTLEIKTEIEPLDTPEPSSDGKINDFHGLNPDVVLQVTFKRYTGGICTKTVTCPKNLKYEIELDGKAVEFLGAPKYISSIEDLQVLLQIVNESSLNSLYVLP